MATTISRYQPETGVTRLPDMMERLFRDSFVLPGLWDRAAFGGSSQPNLPVNLCELQDSYVMYASLPGLKPEDVEIQVTGREVAIKGTFEFQAPENGRWIWQGIPSGEFFEQFTLPVEVNSNEVQATYDHGILTLTLPKAEHLRPKNIKVSVNH